MYETFPGNDVWSLSVDLCPCMGEAMGEIDRANDECARSSLKARLEGRKRFSRLGGERPTGWSNWAT